MFGSMEEALRRRKFSSDEEVIGVVQNWLKTQPEKVFLTKFKKKKTCETLEPVR
jgi:hypothetical protein